MALSDKRVKELEVGFVFAGIEQWRRNLSGDTISERKEAWLTNVSYQNPSYDPSTRELLENSMALFRKRRKAAMIEAKRAALVPDWAPAVRNMLDAQGIPFTGDLISSPEIDLSGVAPLYPKGARPVSLFSLTGFQAGESGFYRSLNFVELMVEIFPLYWRYYHRPAGAPVPPEMIAGFTFGSPVLMPDGTYLRSPVMSTAAYERWSAAGQPE